MPLAFIMWAKVLPANLINPCSPEHEAGSGTLGKENSFAAVSE